MARYVAKPDRWVSPVEESGTLQNASSGVIEISSENIENSGIKLGSGQMISFSGAVYVRSVGNSPCAFTTVPFNAVGKGGEEEKYELPTASAVTKGGVRVGEGLSMSGEVLNVILEAPTANVMRIPGGASISVQDKDGSSSATIYDGQTPEISFVDNQNGTYTLQSRLGETVQSVVVHDGLQGAKGDSGDTDGWIANKQYTVGKLVVYDGNIYQCLVANADSVFNSEKWLLIGSYPVFSSLETVIGTWTDGKTLYQRTYTATTPLVQDTFVKLLDLDSAIDSIININSTCVNVVTGIVDINSVVDIDPVKIVVFNGSVYCKAYGSQQLGVKIYITIKYTKNT